MVVELEGASNVRDLGGIAVGTGREVVPGLIFRGSALASITPADQDVLFRTLGIKCVIDLRCGWERAAKPDVAVSGVDNLHIPFFDLEKVGIEYTEPAEGTKVVGRDVACDPDRFYRAMANPLTARQMGRALGEVRLRATQGQPVYLHCSGGKDRAGIMSLLVLHVLGAGREAVLADYLLTNVSRDANYQQAFERFLRFAEGDEQRAHELTHAHRARRENLEAFAESVTERYGGMEAFVRDVLGVDDVCREELRRACTRPVR
ncbi:MAG: tyrosine-protein phosphatase [Eggerthellaceae bacterium]|nr:tyrosine-protein phosphatase [Eggerthellaceae bacterium]